MITNKDFALDDKMKMTEKEGYKKIKELIENELSDYSYFSIGELEFQEKYVDDEYYSIDITNGRDEIKTLYFKYDAEEKVSIQLSEDNYEVIEDYSYTIKFFWMALLKW